MLLEELGIEVGQLDGVADRVDLRDEATDLRVVDVGDLFEDELLDLGLGHPLVGVAGAAVEQQRVTGLRQDLEQRGREAHDPLLVGVGDDQGSLPVLEQLLEHHDFADLLELERGDDVEGLVEHDLLALDQLVEVDGGADVDPQLATAGEHVDRVVLVAARKVPKPAGGWASRSTSSLSFMIWSRASRSVWARRSFWLVTAASERWVSASRCSRPRAWPGTSVSRRRRSETSASRKRT